MRRLADLTSRPWAVGVGLLAWLACTAWLRPLMLPDEGRYGGVAWEMVQSGQWSVPTLDGMPYFHKPPLFYWIAAAAVRLFGPSEMALRAPSLLGGGLSAFCLYLFARRWCDQRQAGWAVLLLASQPFFFLGAQFANLDMLVAGCITATILLAAHAMMLKAQQQQFTGPLVAAYAMAALGLLAKGLIGAVLPAGALVCWLIAVRRADLLLKLVSVPGLAVFGLIGLPWFVEMQRRYSGYFDYFVIYHHFKRFSEGGFNNQQPFWFYPVVVVVLTLPSSLLLWRALKARAPGVAPLSVPALMWCWFGVVMVFFSLPKSKLIGYVLPALPPFAWLLATGLLTSRLRHAARWAIVGASAVICLIVVVAVTFSPSGSARPVGQALRQQRHPGEPVVFLYRYPFDLPFYARLDVAPVVVGRWAPQDIVRDDWHKELFDAARFEPATGVQQLIAPEALRSLLCSHHPAWLVGTREEVVAVAADAAISEVARTGKFSLWKVSSPATPCPPH